MKPTYNTFGEVTAQTQGSGAAVSYGYDNKGNQNDAVDVDEQLVRRLTERARADGLQLTGEGGLLQRLTKLVVESSLEGELDDHLGYGKHDPAGRDGGNSRNGKRAKTVLTEAGPVEIEVPQDRESSFDRSSWPSGSGACPAWMIW